MDHSRPLNPMADVFVRYLLGSEKNKDLLIDFINAVFRRKGRTRVADLEIRNPFNLREALESKESVLDVKAREVDGRWINVEVQVGHEESFAARSLYYWAKSYQNQLTEGDLYGKLEPSVCINLLGFVIFSELADVHSCFVITEKDNPEFILSEHLQIHYLEVPKLKTGQGADIRDKADAWCYSSSKSRPTNVERSCRFLRYRRQSRRYRRETAQQTTHLAMAIPNVSAHLELLVVLLFQERGDDRGGRYACIAQRRSVYAEGAPGIQSLHL